MLHAVPAKMTIVTRAQPASSTTTARRQRSLPLAALVYLTLVAYPLYIDWQSGLWISPEQLIRQLATQGQSSARKSSRWQRWQVKLSYLVQTLLQRPSLPQLMR